MVYTLGVVVLLDVKLADGARSRTLQKPLIDANFVEEMHAGHGPHFLILLVLNQTHQALDVTFVYYFSGSQFGKFSLSNISDR